jgi:hypothetical protein
MNRRKILRAGIGIAVMVLLISSMAASASPVSKSEQDVFWTPHSDQEGQVEGAYSTLIRNRNGVTMTYKTSGLDRGTVQTIWWVIFNNPEACEYGNEINMCDEPDIFNPDTEASVMYAAGNVVGGNGKANFGGRLNVGDTSGCLRDGVPVALEEGLDELFFPCGDGLDDPMTAEIHLALHDHGPNIPGLTNEMLSTYDGGCANMGHPDEKEEREGLNTCATIQVSPHMAPEQ